MTVLNPSLPPSRWSNTSVRRFVPGAESSARRNRGRSSSEPAPTAAVIRSRRVQRMASPLSWLRKRELRAGEDRGDLGGPFETPDGADERLRRLAVERRVLDPGRGARGGETGDRVRRAQALDEPAGAEPPRAGGPALHGR